MQPTAQESCLIKVNVNKSSAALWSYFSWRVPRNRLPKEEWCVPLSWEVFKDELTICWRLVVLDPASVQGTWTEVPLRSSQPFVSVIPCLSLSLVTSGSKVGHSAAEGLAVELEAPFAFGAGACQIQYI